MALVTIKIFPNEEQIKDFNYSSSDKLAYEFLAKTFYKPLIFGDISYCCDTRDNKEIYSLVFWANGIAIPIDWLEVTALSKDDKIEILKFEKLSNTSQWLLLPEGK